MRPLTSFVISAIVAIGALTLIACGGSPVYSTKGTVLSVSDDKKTFVLRHEDFKDASGKIYMQGMTMEFHVKNPEMLKDITRNDLVKAELTVSNEDEWISKLEKTGHDAAADGDDKANLKSNSGLILMDGQPVPDFELINQEDHPVKLSDFRGKPVVITFIYTRCPFPDMCPRLTHNFARIQKQLAPKYGTRFQLLSITVDPANDNPAALKTYAGNEGADVSSWSFLTGKDELIKKMAGNFGVDYWTEGAVLNHSMASAVIKPDGTLMKVYRHADWNPDDVVADIIHILN